MTAAPGADEVEVVARAFAITQGLAERDPDPEEWWENCEEAHREAYRKDARAALAALAPLRQAERERARADAIEEAARCCDRDAEQCAAEGNARGASEAMVLVNIIRALAPAPAAEGNDAR